MISLGTHNVNVPSVVGKGRTSAIATILDAKFKYKVVYESSDSVNSGVVISQDPSAQSLAALGSVVTIRVSSGPELVKVPLVIGESAATASSTIEALGLKVTATYNPVTSSGKVVSQSPPAGKMVAPGSTVNVEVDEPDPSTP